MLISSSTQWSIDMASKASKQVADSLCKLSATSYERSSACLAALPVCLAALLLLAPCSPWLQGESHSASMVSLLDLLYEKYLLYKKYFGINNTTHRLVLFVKI
jgi:hypothetical protein